MAEQCWVLDGVRTCLDDMLKSELFIYSTCKSSLDCGGLLKYRLSAIFSHVLLCLKNVGNLFVAIKVLKEMFVIFCV